MCLLGHEEDYDFKVPCKFLIYFGGYEGKLFFGGLGYENLFVTFYGDLEKVVNTFYFLRI